MEFNLANLLKISIGGPLIALLSCTEGAVAQTSAALNQVDLELVVTVDVSLPMDRDEQVVARNGYVDAFRSPEFIDAIMHGPKGRIAVTYVEFSDVQTVVVPWTLIDGASSANAFADQLSKAPAQFLRTTSISGDLLFAAGLFDQSGFVSPRRTLTSRATDRTTTGFRWSRRAMQWRRRESRSMGCPLILDPERL